MLDSDIQSVHTQMDIESYQSYQSFADPRIHPCACCSPVIAELNQSMRISNKTLSDPEHWRQKAKPPAAISSRTQIFINARILTVNQDFSVVDAMAIKSGKNSSPG